MYTDAWSVKFPLAPRTLPQILVSKGIAIKLTVLEGWKSETGFTATRQGVQEPFTPSRGSKGGALRAAFLVFLEAAYIP